MKLNYLKLRFSKKKNFRIYTAEKRRTLNIFATNLNFPIPISWQPDGVNLWFFKFRLFDLTVWNIKGLCYLVSKIKGLENQSLWQELDSLVSFQERQNEIISNLRVLKGTAVIRTCKAFFSTNSSCCISKLLYVTLQKFKDGYLLFS